MDISSSLKPCMVSFLFKSCHFRNKYPALTYKITLGDNWWWWNRWWYSKSFVVKFAPPAAGHPAVGSWYDVSDYKCIIHAIYIYVVKYNINPLCIVAH